MVLFFVPSGCQSPMLPFFPESALVLNGKKLGLGVEGDLYKAKIWVDFGFVCFSFPKLGNVGFGIGRA